MPALTGDSGYPLYSKQKDESSSDWMHLQGNPGTGFCFSCRQRFYCRHNRGFLHGGMPQDK